MLQVFSGTFGFGRNGSLLWVAASDQDEARGLLVPSEARLGKLRAVRLLRPVREGDSVAGPGPLVFAGFGVSGPVRSG